MRTLLITEEYFYRMGACYDDRSVFDLLFPEGVEVTEKLAVKHADRFDWLWAIEKLLDDGAETTGIALQEVALAQAVYAQKVRETRPLLYTWPEDPDGEHKFYEARSAAKRKRNITKAKAFAIAFLAQGGRKLLEGEEL